MRPSPKTSLSNMPPFWPVTRVLQHNGKNAGGWTEESHCKTSTAAVAPRKSGTSPKDSMETPMNSENNFIDLTTSPTKKHKIEPIRQVRSEEVAREQHPRSIWDSLSPNTPALSLHPPADKLIISPLSEISVPGVPPVGPALPTLQDIMGLLSKVANDQDRMFSCLAEIEKKTRCPLQETWPTGANSHKAPKDLCCITERMTGC